VAGLTEFGPLAPVLVRSLSEYVSKLGSRVSYGALYDALELYFSEGGSQAYVSRVVGPGATTGTKDIFDAAGSAGSDVSLTATAKGPGAFSSNISLDILAGLVAGFRIQVSYNAVVVETSPDLATQADAIAWAANSSYINLALGVSAENPRVQTPGALSAGNDDRASITDAQWLSALDRFSEDLGPGQVSAPGRTTDPGYTQLTAHAAANNRVALLDATDTATVATVLGDAVAARNNGSYASMWYPWVRIPGLTSGTTRTVPPSALVAGLIGRSDGDNSPNVPAAGDNGESLYAVGLSQGETSASPALTAQQRDQLNSGGVDVIRNLGTRGVRAYGWRTTVDPVATPAWINFGNSRLRMALQAEGLNILEGFLFDQIDGRGYTLQDVKASLTAMCLDFYNQGSLFGETPDEAFYVDVGPQVNTPQTLANLELHAVVSVRMAPFAEFIRLLFVKRAITEAVA
jgi:phage tail sheath protein FI